MLFALCYESSVNDTFVIVNISPAVDIYSTLLTNSTTNPNPVRTRNTRLYHTFSLRCFV